MAKKIKFPLSMRDGYQARNIDELREYFDISKALEYLLDGSLKTWLEDRYYITEAERITKIDPYAKNVKEEMCKLLGVEMEVAAEQVDVEDIERKKERLNRLRQYTDDELIWDQIDNVAFNQEELADLLDDGVINIYLCENDFQIPYSLKNVKYIGVGKVNVFINSSEPIYSNSISGMFERINIQNNDIIEIDEAIDEALDYLWGKNGIQQNVIQGIKMLKKEVDNGNMEAAACLYYEWFITSIVPYKYISGDIEKAQKEFSDISYDVSDNKPYCLLNQYYRNKDDERSEIMLRDKIMNNKNIRCLEYYIEYIVDEEMYISKGKEIYEMLVSGADKRSVLCVIVLAIYYCDNNKELQYYLKLLMEYQFEDGVPVGLSLFFKCLVYLLEKDYCQTDVVKCIEKCAEKCADISYEIDWNTIYNINCYLAFIYSGYRYSSSNSKHTDYIGYEPKDSKGIECDLSKAKSYAKYALELYNNNVDRSHPFLCDSQDYRLLPVVKDIANYGTSNYADSEYQL